MEMWPSDRPGQGFSISPEMMIRAGRRFAHYREIAFQILRPLLGLALALAIVALGAGAGLLATQLSFKIALMVIAGLVAFFTAFSRPELIILLMLIVSSSVVNPKSIPTINIGFKFTAVEICLMFLLGLVALKAMANKNEEGFVRTPLDLPVLLFFIASTLSFFNAMYNLGTDRGYLVPQWRVLFDYLVFFAVTNLVRTRAQFRLFTRGVLVIATITAALSVVQAAVGSSVKILPKVNMGMASVFDEEFVKTFRVIAPGAPLIFIVFLPTLILYATLERMQARKKLALATAILLMLVAIAYTFSRTWWVGLAISLALLVFFNVGHQRPHLLKKTGMLLIVLILSTWFLITYFPQLGDTVQALELRAGSLFTGERIKNDGGTLWRMRENESAIARIKEHPLLGVGPGGPLRQAWWNGDTLTRYMHNSYLFILADLGVIGFVPFLGFSIVFLLRGFYYGHRLPDPILKGWVLGLTLSYVTLAIASISGPEFMSDHTTPVVGMMLGINEVAIRLGQPSA